MADKNDSRRKLLKSIAAGSGAVVAGKALPESWSKPVINSVMLPAHAETTDDTGSEGGEVTTTLAATTPAPPVEYFGRDLQMMNFSGNAGVSPAGELDLFDGIVDSIITPAYAGELIPTGTLGGMSILVEGSSATIEFTGNYHPRLFRVVASTSGVPSGSPTFVEGCPLSEGSGPISAEMVGYTDSAENARVRITSNGRDGVTGWEVVVPKNPIEPLTAVCVASDIRLKINIEHLSASRKGFNLYRFQYLAETDKNTYVGIMAQDVMGQHPEAIVKNEDGYYMVRYDLLGLKMVTLDEWENKGPESVELIH